MLLTWRRFLSGEKETNAVILLMLPQKLADIKKIDG